MRVEGELLADTDVLGAPGTPLHGYEIHMGRTTLGRGAAPLLRLRGADGEDHDDGAAAVSVCGSYVHGIFDGPELRTAFLNGLRTAAGLVRLASAASSPDDDIDRLADHVEVHLDAGLLARIVGLEVR
jgi:adenosylcobyric acid synthase